MCVLRHVDCFPRLCGLTMDEEKVLQVLNWPPLKSVKQLQQFLGFTNLYWSFIKDYSCIIVNLSSLVKKLPCDFKLKPQA